MNRTIASFAGNKEIIRVPEKWESGTAETSLRVQRSTVKRSALMSASRRMHSARLRWVCNSPQRGRARHTSVTRHHASDRLNRNHAPHRALKHHSVHGSICRILPIQHARVLVLNASFSHERRPNRRVRRSSEAWGAGSSGREKARSLVSQRHSCKSYGFHSDVQGRILLFPTQP